MPHVLRACLLAGTSLLLLAGCGFGTSAPREAAPKEKVTRAQLAAMVLPKAKLGSSAKGLVPQPGSGVMTNVKYAATSLDPADSAGSLKGNGRVLGYDSSYQHPQLGSRKVRGTMSISTGVELLEDSVYATQYLHARLNDFERLRGTVDRGIKLRNVSYFEVAGIGDAAGGARGTVAIPGVLTGHETVVGFRRGRIVAYVTVFRGDRRDARQQALRLAVALDKRIQDVLSGELAVKPEKRAKADPALVAARKKLPEMTMAAEDVGPGVRVVDEGKAQGVGYKAYRRAFRDVLVGSSHLIALVAETQVYDAPNGAVTNLKYIATAAGRQEYAQAVVKGFRELTRVKPSNVRARPMKDPGRGMKGIVVTFEYGSAKFTTAALFFGSGRVVQAVSGTCRREAFDPNDLKSLARRAQARLTAV